MDDRQFEKYLSSLDQLLGYQSEVTKGYYNANHACVTTNSYFTKPARKLAIANDVLLFDRVALK
ncbi:restriction endonuclease [Bacillus sp. XF8]|uniref:restriction endonuclease n=1 Tax=Bacillus sp. XF8 TaxID=2819289 RepID=UPI001FB69958|nr:restriction endonuclease [Bacillus sp. XF8]